MAERAPERTFPPGLWEVIAKALAKKPEDRFQSAAEFGRALEDVARGRAGAAPGAPARGAVPPADEERRSAMSTPVARPLAGSGAEAPPPASAAPTSSRGPWLVLAAGALLAVLGTAMLVAALLMR